MLLTKKTLCSLMITFTVCMMLAGCAGKKTGDPSPAPADNLLENASVEEAMNEDGQNPVMNFIGDYACGRACITVEAVGKNDAKISVHWGSSAWEVSVWEMTGAFDEETVSVAYENAVRQNITFGENGEEETVETVYENGTGRFVFHESPLSLTWEDDEENAAEDMIFEYASYGMPNPWREATEEEAITLCPRLFKAPEGAENGIWRILDAAGENESPLVELQFDLDGKSFAARAKYGADENEDISGLYYDWTVSDDTDLHRWGDDPMPAKDYRFIGEDETVDLVTWYDIEIGIAYSLTTSASDLDGFDIRAVAEAMYDPDKEPSFPEE